MRTPFLGPGYVARSRTLADQRLINLFAEIVETKSGKDVGAFYMTPGLTLKVTVGSGPIRGMRNIAHWNSLLVVSGDEVFLVDPALRVGLVGTIGTSAGPVTMIDNHIQAAIFDGSNGYCLPQGGSLALINLPISGSPVSCAYQDDFGVVNFAGTQLWYQSNVADLTTWNALNFSAGDAAPDDVQAIANVHREMWLIKQFDTEVWINGGLPGFVFQRLQGVYLEAGTPAPYSPTVVGEGLVWLAQNRQGQLSVVMSEGYRLHRISTDAVDFALESYSTVNDAIGYSYGQEGHLFYVLVLPTANKTWCYDVSASRLAGIPMWHERASLRNGQFSRHWSNAFAYFNGKPLVGDYRNGNIYALDLDQELDNGVQRKWLRSWRAFPKPPEDVMQFNQLHIDMETGINVATGTSPQLMLRWSDTGGHTWSNELKAPADATGQYGRRVMFTRLGSTRRGHGFDRIFELSSTDQFKVALIGAELS